MIDTAGAIKESVTCKQFADFVGLSVNRAGFAVCPFHADTDASLKIYKGGRGWCCFGCHKGGDVINLAMNWYGVPFKDALRRLNDDFNLGLYNGSQESPTSGLPSALSAVQIAQRKIAREKEERAKQALEGEYWAVYDKLEAVNRIIDGYNPQSMDEDMPREVARAYMDRDGLQDRLNTLGMERISYDPDR